MIAYSAKLRHPLYSTLLVLISLLGVFPLDVILPSFPTLADRFRVGAEQIAYSVSFFAVGVAMAQLVIGPLSDSIGRKRLLLGGLGLAILGALGCACSTTYQMFMAFRLLQALGCGSLVLGQALVQDLYRDEHRNTMRILLTSSSGLFISISPLVGALLQQSFGWQASFISFAIIATIVSLLAYVLLPSTTALQRKASGISSYRIMLRDTTFLAYTLQTSLAFSCHFSFIVIAPLLLMSRLGLTTYQFSIVFIGYGVAYIAGGAAATYLNRRVSPQAQIKAGFLLISAGGITLVIWERFSELSVAGIMLAVLICTTGTTLVRPAATTQALARYPCQAGAAASLNTTFLFAGAGGISSVVAGVERTLPGGLGLLFVLASLCGGWLLAYTKVDEIPCR
ncbi:Bcr/CflA family efflux MFS transporter [Pseudomonas juntendi]|uniref:Bcr/CflA family efflux transporter n=1 Tax=Pseudomonas juntendi TaxID=2666183 RepID=A0A7W2KJ35_9PSED|nr:Bcr/CflA family efflux MFS transporter [Pseudomonas juntendi]MBA6099468.1 Bcr/CflA family efflux MFS transporter [Pseudomonas juntendi]